jgi:hypothetical protein
MRALTDTERERLDIFRRSRRRWIYWGDLGLSLLAVEGLIADGWLRWRDPRNQYRVALNRPLVERPTKERGEVAPMLTMFGDGKDGNPDA